MRIPWLKATASLKPTTNNLVMIITYVEFRG